jgi:hypothetical protein
MLYLSYIHASAAGIAHEATGLGDFPSQLNTFYNFLLLKVFHDNKTLEFQLQLFHMLEEQLTFFNFYINIS